MCKKRLNNEQLSSCIKLANQLFYFRAFRGSFPLLRNGLFTSINFGRMGCDMRVVRDEGLYCANVMMWAVDPDYLDWDIDVEDAEDEGMNMGGI